MQHDFKTPYGCCRHFFGVVGLPWAPAACCIQPPFPSPPPQFYNLTWSMPWPLDSSAAAMLASICNLLSEIIKVQSGDSGEVES